MPIIVERSSKVMLPAPCAVSWGISSGFGYDPKYPANSGWHYGIDYKTPVGTPCWFRESGTVVIASNGQPHGFPNVNDGAWGNYVEIVSDRDPTLRWGLAHLSQIFVSVGDHVQTGQVIGYTGGWANTLGAGTSTGPHLHEQALVDDGAGIQRIDPDVIMALAQGDATGGEQEGTEMIDKNVRQLMDDQWAWLTELQQLATDRGEQDIIDLAEKVKQEGVVQIKILLGLQ